jgi:hypothetical protein
MSLTGSFSVSRVRSIAVAGLAVLAGVGVMGAGSAHAATTPAGSPLYQHATNTFVPAGISAPVQSVGGGAQDLGSGDQDPGSGDPFPGDPGNYQLVPVAPPRYL